MPEYITDAQLEREIQEKLKIEINKLAQSLLKVKQQDLAKAKDELTGYMKIIVYTTFNKVFLGTYGYNFDTQNLNESVECIIKIVGGELRPDILYDKNHFQLDYSIQQDTCKFNDNVSSENFDRLLDMMELDVMEEDGELTAFETPYDIAVEEIGVSHLGNNKIFSPINKAQRQGGFKSIDETFLKAKIKALNNFLEEYNKYLKPRLAQKYNIQL